MKYIFVPEYRMSTFEEASADFLSSIGVRGIVLDIDNTLEPYEHENPGEHVIHWLKSLSDAGIKTAIVSNNGWERVNTFNSNIGMPAYAKSGKPFAHNIKKAMMDMGTDPTSTIMMGDQVFTDVLAAHNAGIRAILVPPINDKKDFLTRFKRLLEVPVLEKYERIHKNDTKL